MQPTHTDPVYDEDDQRPVTGPDLRRLEGGATGRSRQATGGTGAGTSGTGSGNFSFNPKGDRSSGSSSATSQGASPTSSGTGFFNSGGLSAAETAAGAAIGTSTATGGFKALAKNTKNFFWGTKTRKRSSVTTGVVTLTAGGIIVGGSLLSGPFEFVHIAQMLQQFHFSTQQDESEDRVSKLIRYAHYAPNGEAYKTNLSYVGNKLADKFEAKLNEQGLKSAYTKTFGLKDGYIIDRENDRFKGMTDDEIKQSLKGEWGNDKLEFSTITDDNGNEHLFVKQPSGYRDSVRISRVEFKKNGYGKTTSAIGARIMGTRDGVTWHPLQKLDRKVYKTLDEKIAQWNKEKSENISKGTPTASAEAKPQDEPGATDEEKAQTAANADETAGQGQDVADEGDSVKQQADSGGDTDNGKLSSFADSIHAKIALGGAAAIGVACMVRGIAQNAGEIKQAQTAMPLIRTGVRALSEGSQVPASQDIDIDQLSNDSKQLVDQNGKSWYDAESIQAEVGKPDQGTPPDKTLRTLSSGTPFDFLVGGTPLADALGPVCSAPAQIGLTIVSFLGGPVSTAASLLTGEIIGQPFSDAAAQYLAGQAVKLNPSGPEFGNYINFGAFLASNDQAISGGGRALNSNERTQLADITNSDYEQQFQKQNIAYRLFNPSDRMSLVSTLIDKQSGGIRTNTSNLALATANIGNSLATTFANIFSGVGHAASQPYNYGGMPEVAFSEGEMSNPNTENPYANGDVAADILSSSAGAGYIDRAQKCFGDTIQQTSVPGLNGGSNQVWDVQYGTEPVNIYSADYKNIEGSCNDSNDLNWLRIRFFIFDTQNIKAANCYEGDDQSCSEMGFPSPGGGSGVSPTQTTVTGSAQDIAQQILANKNITYDCGSSAQDDIKDAANGKPGTAGAPLNPEILTLIATIGQTHQVCVSALESYGQGHASGSYHYTGDAVDFGSLDGVRITGRNQPALTIIRIAEDVLPKGTQFGQSDCGPEPSFAAGFSDFPDSCDHLHVQVPR